MERMRPHNPNIAMAGTGAPAFIAGTSIAGTTIAGPTITGVDGLTVDMPARRLR